MTYLKKGCLIISQQSEWEIQEVSDLQSVYANKMTLSCLHLLLFFLNTFLLCFLQNTFILKLSCIYEPTLSTLLLHGLKIQITVYDWGLGAEVFLGIGNIDCD